MCEWLSSAEWCDVRLVVGARAFSAHRAVLASVSVFLKHILLTSKDDCSPIFIVLPDFDVEAMFSVLYYVYNGEVFVKQEKMESFLDIIKTLQIYVDGNFLSKTNEPSIELDTSNRLVNLSIDSCKLNVECSKKKPHVIFRKSSQTINTVKAPYTVDLNNSRMQCCNQNPAHKPLENLHSPNKDRQRKSWLRDSFIETYPRNCYANGSAAVPAMTSVDYLDPTSVPLVNANDYRTLHTIFSATAEPQSASQASYSSYLTTDTSQTRSDYNDLCKMTPAKNYEQLYQQNVADNNDRACAQFTIRLTSLKDGCRTNRENNIKRAKTILNAVQKNPWSTQQPMCFKPFRRKHIPKNVLNMEDNDSNNNLKSEIQSHLKFDDLIGEEVKLPGNPEVKRCNVCLQVFPEDDALVTHSKLCQSSTARYTCAECGKTFSQLRNYKYHMSVHRGTKEFAATCSVCGKYFNDRGYLSSHMKIHRNRKEYKCPQCPKSFNQRVAYNMHVKIHTGIKPHVCEQCGKAFSRKMLLKQHQRTHSGERPYACAHCGKRFADRSNMTLHLRLHTGVKPFSCTLCQKSFTKKHHLKSHLNYHTGSKPYSCPHCKLSFTQSSNMRTHMKKCITERKASIEPS